MSTNLTLHCSKQMPENETLEGRFDLWQTPTEDTYLILYDTSREEMAEDYNKFVGDNEFVPAYREKDRSFDAILTRYAMWCIKRSGKSADGVYHLNEVERWIERKQKDGYTVDWGMI